MKQLDRRSALALFGTASAAGLGLVTSQPAAGVVPAAGRPWGPRLYGSFIQPWLAESWDAVAMKAEHQVLKEAGMSLQVLQHSADSQSHTTVFPTRIKGFRMRTQRDVVETMLTSADQTCMKVMVGLQDNTAWWSKYANDRDWLTREAYTSKQLCYEIIGKYGHHKSFGGIYLPFEVDNVNFSGWRAQLRMSRYYQLVGRAAHERNANLPVMIAPFFNASTGMQPNQWRDMWTRVLKDAGSAITVIALQDGIGVGHAKVGDLPAWFSATKQAINASSSKAQLWSDCETFLLSNGTYGPMPTSSFVADMRAISRYVSRYISFSYDHYQSPRVVSAEHHRAYLNYLSGIA